MKVTRKAALARIRAEVAENGKITGWALDAYISSRISYSVFMQAAREGMAIYNRKGA